jgi:hypothetical protein
MKAVTLHVVGLNAATVALLQDAINAWFAASLQRTFISAQYEASAVAGSEFSCLIFYTE